MKGVVSAGWAVDQEGCAHSWSLLVWGGWGAHAEGDGVFAGMGFDWGLG